MNQSLRINHHQCAMKGGARLLGDVQEAQRQLRGGPVQRAVPVDRGLPHLQAREQDLRPVLLRERAPRQGVRHGIHPRSHGKQGATCPKSQVRNAIRTAVESWSIERVLFHCGIPFQFSPFFSFSCRYFLGISLLSSCNVTYFLLFVGCLLASLANHHRHR